MCFCLTTCVCVCVSFSLSLSRSLTRSLARSRSSIYLYLLSLSLVSLSLISPLSLSFPSQALVDSTQEKLVLWETKLVDLSNQRDKSKEKMLTEKLKREELAGLKKVAEGTFNSEETAYKQTVSPYQREIYVITMIKMKIVEHCDRLAKGEASIFGQ
jgi:hypothetical protein